MSTDDDDNNPGSVWVYRQESVLLPADKTFAMKIHYGEPLEVGERVRWKGHNAAGRLEEILPGSGHSLLAVQWDEWEDIQVVHHSHLERVTAPEELAQAAENYDCPWHWDLSEGWKSGEDQVTRVTLLGRYGTKLTLE